MHWQKASHLAGSSAVGLINGSMAVAKQAAKVKKVIRSRQFLSEKSVVFNSESVLSQTQSPYPVGSQFTAGTLLFNIAQLHPNARNWVQSYDQYRIANIEVFCTLNTTSKNGSIDRTAPVEVYFYEDTDADPNTQTSWIRTADRSNVARVVLTAWEPSQKLISFMPTVTLTAGALDQNPANIVPKKGTWLDALSIQQLHSGVRFFACCPSVDTSGTPSYVCSLNVTARITVEVQQPI